MTNNHSDVTVSVWNDFWSAPLVAGLHNAGFKVTHHTTGRQKAPCDRFIRNIPAAALNHLAYRKFIPQNAAHAWSRKIIDYTGYKLAKSSNSFWGWSGCSLAGLQAAKAAGKPAILERGSSHCVWQKERVGKEYKRLGLHDYELPSEREIAYDLAEYEVADAICVPSKFVLNTFLEEGIKLDKLHINPYGVDVKLWRRVEGAQRNSGPMVFVYTASVTARKGAHILLKAWELARLKDAELWLCGGIHLPIKQLGLPIGKNIKFLGFTQHKDLVSIYDRASVYILPSLEEGMARSGIEAMASGLPIIVTKETGLTDLMHSGSEGWIVESGNAQHLAETFQEVSSRRGELLSHSLAARKCTIHASQKEYGDRAVALLQGFLATFTDSPK